MNLLEIRNAKPIPTIISGSALWCLFLKEGIRDQVAMTALIQRKTNSITWLAKKVKPLKAEKVSRIGNAAQCTAQSIDARNPRKSLLRERKLDVLIVFAILIHKYMQQYCKWQEMKLISVDKPLLLLSLYSNPYRIASELLAFVQELIAHHFHDGGDRDHYGHERVRIQELLLYCLATP